MPFPPSFLDELRARVTVSSVIGKRVKITRAGREYKALCPFHHEKSPSFTINDDKGFYHCFGCGAHGDVITFTMRNGNLGFMDAIEQLATQAGLAVPQSDPKERQQYDRQKLLRQLLEAATQWFQQQLKEPHGRDAWAYVQKRGLDADACEKFRLGYAPQDARQLMKAMQTQGYSADDLLEVGLLKKPDDGREPYSFFRDRLIFPVGDRRGTIVAFGARLLAGDGPKYINSPDHPMFHKGRLLYGLSRARQATPLGQPLIVVEGYMDVIALVQAGYHGAVAPLGTALTENQVEELWHLLPPLQARDAACDYAPILCFDGDAAGQRAALRAIDRTLPLIAAGKSIRIATLPSGEDPDSLITRTGKSAMQAVLDQAMPLVEALWSILINQRRLNTPEDRASLKTAIAEKLNLIRDDAVRTLYKEEFQRRLTSLFQQNQPIRLSSWQAQRPSRQAPAYNPSPTILRRQPVHKQDLRERILLACLINNPAIHTEISHDFDHWHCLNPLHETIRVHLNDFFAETTHEALDETMVYGHLLTRIQQAPDAAALSKCLTDLLSEATYIHAGFSRPGRAVPQVLEGWNDVWTTWLRERVQTDLEAAARAFDEDGSEENHRRLLGLREEAERLSARA